MGDKKSFVFYTEYKEQLAMLPPEQVGELVFALIDYQETGETPELPKGSALAMCFSFIKSRIDKDNAKYEEKCERNQKNAKKGGRPAKDTATVENEEKANGLSENRTVSEKPNGLEENRTVSKKPDNDNEYDNEEYLRTPPNTRAHAREEAGKSRKESAVKTEPVTYSDDPELNDAIMEFIKFRKGIKKPMSERGITLMINKLDTLSHDKHEQVQILNQSIMQGWTGIYELKDDRQNKNRGQPKYVNPNGFANFTQTDHSGQLDELERLIADDLNKNK